ncbi:NADH-quinone oxidoreductase subunit NuoE [Actinoplanes sp. NPDC051470]|uniref:NADH-quinone oxidoreductase subunit NuoE n=1 Tax=Actinoplanes sp. NPDC051470 TaxID=3157224 RepID=UPI003448A97C
MSETTVEFSPAATPLAEKLLDPALEIIARYPAGRGRSALLPLLHLVQTTEGHVSPAGVAFCAEILGINKAQVGAVATFYTMYKRRPTGEYLVSVCTNTLCNVLGGQQVYDELSEHLGVGHDETTTDGTITLEHAECLAACDYAPVVTVNYDFAIDQATPESTIGLVEQLRKGERPQPSRGGRICTLKEMQVQLAGFADDRIEAVADGPAGAPTLRGVTLAQEHGVSVPDFNLDTPITTTKPARDESAKAVKDAEPATSPLLPGRLPASRTAATTPPAEGRVTRAAKKAAGAVKAAAGAVTNRHAGEETGGEDVKDPETRTAEKRNPTMGEPDRTGDSQARTPAPSNAAEASGVAQTTPSGDGSPAGDARPAAADGSEEKK